ncbi:hypothetical protein ACIPXV_38760 [Streptomyces libani]|uniref:hypothetical protein n=1 Tax=Streptomyces nigrescens TaxID=1920 RepID=UPI0038185D01
MAYESSVPYRAGTEGYTSFRIPAVVPARSGHLLAFAEGRVSSAADATEDRIRRGRVPPADGRRVRLQRSDDNGASWSPPREITDQARLPQRRRYATGPGHALQPRHGRYAGRLLVPANHSTPPTDTQDSGAEPRRDGGLTWRTAHTVGGLPAACSDLVRLDRDSVGLLHETGDFSAYSTITFRRIPVEEPT